MENFDMKVLITGGAGYIGSHILVQLLKSKFDVMVFDNFSTSNSDRLDSVRKIAGDNFICFSGDIRNKYQLSDAFFNFRPKTIVHLAGLKSISDSISRPQEYYENNVVGSINLLEAMDKYDCRNLVFSSSASVYGKPCYLPFDEEHPLTPSNPYSRSKFFVEQIVQDWQASASEANALILRYFNPVGAHSSGLIGDNPVGLPSNLMPYLSRVAAGELSHFRIFGDDYETRDGTGERDYIHIEDLAEAHISAINCLENINGCQILNIGTGKGTTVLEILNAYQKIVGRDIPYKVYPRRKGDIAKSYTAVRKSEKVLGWKSKLGVEAMCRSAWDRQLSIVNGGV